VCVLSVLSVLSVCVYHTSVKSVGLVALYRAALFSKWLSSSLAFEAVSLAVGAQGHTTF
jgi:hypothetical protein